MKQVPEKNDVVTISPNKVTGDRSYADEKWCVVAVNNTHAQLQTINNNNRLGGILSSTVIVVIKEHDFSDASDFMDEE